MRRVLPRRSLLILAAVAGCTPKSGVVAPPRSCVTCHDADRGRPQLPPHLQAGFPTSCGECHTQAAWKPAAFAHLKTPLAGKHAALTCKQCHATEPVPRTCIGCHEKDRSRPGDPDHRAAGFSTRCEDCHTLDGWKPASVDHSRFPFLGGHAAVACARCHPDSLAQPRAKTCAGCHDADRARAKYPDHLAAGFPTGCESCHTIYTWKSPSYSHATFPLLGAHSALECARCHSKQPLPTTCAGCHDADRARPTSPNHLAAGFPTACNHCHGVNAWKPASFDHSKYPLTGRHSTVACASCHTDPKNPSKPTATTCHGCHQADLAKPKTVAHGVPGFPTDCQKCHTVNGWQPAAFDHSAFPLAGGHGAVACASCHASSPVPKTCFGCHAKDRARPTSPNHLAAGFSTSCETCHTTIAWTPAATSHTKFPLSGGHAAVSCAACHPNPASPSTPKATTCYGCHQAQITIPGDPLHTVAGFPTACESCHNTTSWKNATYAHTKFALTGKHATLACSSCHPSGSIPTASTCVGCHAKDRSTPATPDHLAVGFSTACDSCHGTAGWKPAAFDHSKFPLTGKHAALGCVACHPDPAKPSTPTATSCHGCHASKGAAVKLPDHSAAGFPTACSSCHTTGGWKPATFNHASYFPTTGPHAKACSACHLDPANPASFSCLGTCHKHTQTAMDSKHKGVATYTYSFAACVQCHK